MQLVFSRVWTTSIAGETGAPRGDYASRGFLPTRFIISGRLYAFPPCAQHRIQRMQFACVLFSPSARILCSDGMRSSSSACSDPLPPPPPSAIYRARLACGKLSAASADDLTDDESGMRASVRGLSRTPELLEHLLCRKATVERQVECGLSALSCRCIFRLDR